MKLFISAGIEGTAGIVNWSETESYDRMDVLKFIHFTL